MIGAIDRQGPHHGAQASISTGLPPALRSTWSKVASVTVMGLASVDADDGGASSLAPHCPHLACNRAARSSIRFFAPQSGHWMIVAITNLSVSGSIIGRGPRESERAEILWRAEDATKLPVSFSRLACEARDVCAGRTYRRRTHGP